VDLFFSVNIGARLSLDDTSLSQGELYTSLTNKESKGKKRSVIACIKRTKAKEITAIISKKTIKTAA
jgi:hypothetical protein